MEPTPPPPENEPPRRQDPRATAVPMREFKRTKRSTTLADLWIPLVALGLAATIFYLQFQRKLIADVLAVNDTRFKLTLQLNLERLPLEPGESGKMRVFHVGGESLEVLSGGGTTESIYLPNTSPAWVIYNVGGVANLLLVDYTWAYGADGERNTAGPQFKVVANLKANKLFTCGEAEVLGPDEKLPQRYQGKRPLLKVERVPTSALEFPETYLREQLEKSR